MNVPPIDYGKTNNFGGVSLTASGAGQPVPVISLDALHLPACDLLKIDVEGMEAEVIRGADQVLRSFRPLCSTSRTTAGRGRPN